MSKVKEVKVLFKDLRKEVPKGLMETYEKEFLEVKKEEIDNEKAKSKKFKLDPEEEILFTCLKELKMLKREVTNGDLQCDVCFKHFKIQSALNKHKKIHQKPKSFKCGKCHKLFSIEHRFKVHSCVRSLTCSHCKKTLSCESMLKAHLKNVHKLRVISGDFTCDFCGDGFNEKGKLALHLKARTCWKKFTCDQCGMKFSRKGSMAQHSLSHAVHLIECEICHLKLKQSSFKDHIYRMHPATKNNFKCKNCSKKFASLFLLNNHLKNYDKKFECKFCQRKFLTQSKLNAHLKFHENPEQFRCQICEYQSTTKGNLTNHLKTHDENREKNLKCTRCSYKTDCTQNFQKHLKTHQKADEKLKKFDHLVKCEKCPSIVFKKYLNQHLSRQHGSNNSINVQCDLCEYSSNSKTNFKRHFLTIHVKK